MTQNRSNHQEARVPFGDISDPLPFFEKGPVAMLVSGLDRAVKAVRRHRTAEQLSPARVEAPDVDSQTLAQVIDFSTLGPDEDMSIEEAVLAPEDMPPYTPPAEV